MTETGTHVTSRKPGWSARALCAALGALAAGLLAACQTEADVPETELDERPSLTEVDKGEAIAELVCSACHAVGRDDTGPHPDATPFRDISRNYPIERLADSLTRGIIVDHPDMPPFSFPPDEVDALIDYMKRIQSPHET